MRTLLCEKHAAHEALNSILSACQVVLESYLKSVAFYACIIYRN